MSGANGASIDREELEHAEQAKAAKVTELAREEAALEQRLAAVKQALAQEIGGLTTLRSVLGLPPGGEQAKPRPRRRSAKKR